MDRRSWPWRKKSSDKSTSVAVSANASPAIISSRPLDQGMSKMLVDHAHDSIVKYQQAEDKCQQTEERIRQLNDKLSVVLAENTEKEKSVKQHAKVAEEAVSGWEKAETEAATLKKQLDAVNKQKAALEDQLSHMDIALKECVRQARQTKEEQEQRLQDVMVKKTKEYEKLRIELEGRLAEVGRRLLESGAENKALALTLKDRLRTISEVTEAKSQAEAEIQVLHIRLENMDKDNMAMKYEVQVLNKEVDVRNEEREYIKREAEALNKKHQESLKTITKLEAECQRLRALVRRKLPGPAALAQIKQEVDAFSKEERRRSLGRVPSSFSSGEFMQNRFHGSNREVQFLSDRLVAMEEETKMLREVLAQRNSELQAAKLMNARTASKLSTLELNSETASCKSPMKGRQAGFDMPSEMTRFHTPSMVSMSRSECETNDDEASCADAWASALVSELSQFKKERRPPNLAILQNSPKLMDDFIEMEQLASQTDGVDACKMEKEINTSEEQVIQQGDNELRNLYLEANNKLSTTLADFNALQERNAANEAAIIKLQEKLDSISEFQAQDASIHNIANNDHDSPCLQDHFSPMKTPEKQEHSSHSELKANVCKFIDLIEMFAQAIGVQQLESRSGLTKLDVNIVPSKHWEDSVLDGGIQKLVAMGNKLLDGQVKFTEFTEELSSLLNIMICMFVNANKKRAELDKEPTADDGGYAESCSKEELAKLQLEISLLEKEVEKLPLLEQELLEMRTEKEKIQCSLKEATVKIDELQNQLVAEKELVKFLRADLAASEESNQELNSELAATNLAKSQLEVKAKTTEAIQDKVVTLEAELEEERRRHQKLMATFQELEEQIDGRRIANGCSMPLEGAPEAVDSTDKITSLQNLTNEHEIAEKLAECQRTISVLGEQLKALSSPQDIPEASTESCGDSIDKHTPIAGSLCHSREIGCENDDHNNVHKGKFDWVHKNQDCGWSPPRVMDPQMSPFPYKNHHSNLRAELPEMYKNSLFSPEHDYGDGPTVPTSPSDAHMWSPLRSSSPKKLSHTRSRGMGTNEISKSTAQTGNKHGSSSFSRFFSRGRSSS